MSGELVTQEQPKAIAIASPMALIEVAVANNADVDKLEKLMALQERWDAKQAREAFFEAMAKFQSMAPVIKKLKAGHRDVKYAAMEDIQQQIAPILTQCGLSYRFEQSQDQSSITVICIVTHKNGHSETARLTSGYDVSGNKSNIQSIGSSLSYLRRYCLIGAFGLTVADEDTDGRMTVMNGDFDLTAWVDAINDVKSMEEFNNLMSQAQSRGYLSQLKQTFNAKKREFNNAHSV